jgi:single-strand DNA-binding protein
MNTVHLVGKIATDIRVREFPSKTRPEPMVKAQFLMVIPAPKKDGQPDWVPVETWNTQAKNLVRFNRKGSRIAVTGRIRSQFFDPNGKERGGSLRPTVVAEGIDYLTQPNRAAAASVGETITAALATSAPAKAGKS